MMTGYYTVFLNFLATLIGIISVLAYGVLFVSVHFQICSYTVNSKVCNFDLYRPYGRYISVRQVAGTRTTRYRAVPPKIDRRRSISVVDGRLREKSTVDNRLREKSTVGGRLSEKKGRRRRGKEEKKKRGEEERIPSARVLSSPVGCQRLRAVLARVPSPPPGRGRFFSRAGRKVEVTSPLLFFIF
ncbi:hypothetical protein GW17_00051034 [Ensete ventricosum]|nr:hypothetical protein GW17_00051034 [Ensete ventricosum]